jgi:hypothetical protein
VKYSHLLDVGRAVVEQKLPRAHHLTAGRHYLSAVKFSLLQDLKRILGLSFHLLENTKS